MFTEQERHALAYALERAINLDALDLAWNLIDPNDGNLTISAAYWDARHLGTMGRLYIEINEALV